MQFIQGILFHQNYPLVHQFIVLARITNRFWGWTLIWKNTANRLTHHKADISSERIIFYFRGHIFSICSDAEKVVPCVVSLKENCTKMTWDYQKRNKKFPFTKYLFHSAAGTTIFFIFFLRRLSSLWCHRLLLRTKRGLRARGPSLTCMLPLPKWSLNDYENTTLQLWSKVITKVNFFIF